MRIEQIGDCTLYHGDCLEIIPTLDKVDAVVTDPPYGIGFKYDGEYDDLGGTEYQKLISPLKGLPTALLQYPEEMMRLVCPVLGPPDEVLAWVYGSNLPRQLRLWGFWGCDVDPKRSTQLARNPECSKVKNINVSGYDWREIPQTKNTSKEKTDHPCQLPLRVAVWVLECLNANLVADPFMGSGTTGVACVKAGKRFIGIEREAKYFDIACRRIEETYQQPDMFVQQPQQKPEQQQTLI